MALASGGQAIEVSKKQLPGATGIISDTATSALVGLNWFVWFLYNLNHVAGLYWLGPRDNI